MVFAGSLEDADGLLWVVMIRHTLRTPPCSAENWEAMGTDPPLTGTRFQHQARWPAVGAGAAGDTGFSSHRAKARSHSWRWPLATEHGAVVIIETIERARKAFAAV